MSEPDGYCRICDKPLLSHTLEDAKQCMSIEEHHLAQEYIRKKQAEERLFLLSRLRRA